MSGDSSFPAENPFCTRRIKPGALPYFFPRNDADPFMESCSVEDFSSTENSRMESILRRLHDVGGWGEIIGPHGAGKSTLLAGLIALLEAKGRQVQRIDLHDGQRRLPVDLRKLSATNGPFLIVVDGYEQLSRWSRFQLKRHCRRCNWGLIVTTHRPTGLPLLFDATASLEQAYRVVEELLKDCEASILRKDVAESYARHKGNLREMLFELYDLFEQRRSPRKEKAS
jgi:energy-coupling factor transporter ATP-binding protein EcfA2